MQPETDAASKRFSFPGKKKRELDHFYPKAGHQTEFLILGLKLGEWEWRLVRTGSSWRIMFLLS